MQLESADDLIRALRVSGLFTPEQFEVIVREFADLGNNPNALMKKLVQSNRVTRYQLKKTLLGKASELFIGPYLIIDKLGDGGVGKVFRARRIEGDDEPVALKVVRPGLIANPVVRGRYAREVQAAHALAHPNIVRLLDAGEANGRFYLAMEFVDGIDLAKLITTYGRLEIAEACEYARQVALGLQHAHEMGFIHRDVKPSNIVVAGERHLPQATQPAVVKLLDLGLARAIDPDDMVAPNLTRDHTLVGTPDYMAPEQAKNSKRADARCDLYSLGCTMYFLLTGRVPFPQAGGLEKIVAHQSELPAPLQALRPDVPAEVAEIVARLMAKKPDSRIQSARELVVALEQYSCYAPDAAPVPISIDDQSANDTLPPSHTPPNQNPDTSNLVARRDSNSPSGVAGAVLPNSKPRQTRAVRPTSTAAVARGTLIQTQNRPQRTRRAVPRIVWVTVALGGVIMLAALLWLVSSLMG